MIFAALQALLPDFKDPDLVRHTADGGYSMGWASVMQGRLSGSTPCGTIIVGVGDSRRRDDGIGPYIVERLEAILNISDAFRFFSVPGLTFDILGELQSADGAILIDSTADILEQGWRCATVMPGAGFMHLRMKHLNPAFASGFSNYLCHRKPPVWVLSVQGDDFGFGEGLTPAARKRVEKAFSHMVEKILRIHEKC